MEKPQRPGDVTAPLPPPTGGEICERFEHAWQAGVSPRLEDFLRDAPPPKRDALLASLLPIELSYRQGSGSVPAAEEYRARFPGHEECIAAAFDAVRFHEAKSLAADASSLNRSKADTAVPLAAAKAPEPEESKMPERIGRYVIVRRLGRGGFGTVWLAEDEELQRQVAVKVPRRHRLCTQESVSEFLREARTAAALRHPNIVTVYDVGRQDDGGCFVVMEYVAGRSLAEQLQSARPDHRRSVEWMTQVADAVHYAHKQGLVHRDLKPANILLDGAGRPYVADFGLALRDDDYGRSWRDAGTPAYMSPEQARGEGHLVDARSDVYSLGVVLYELLSGRRPYRHPKLPDLLNEIASVDIRPPRQYDDTIPKELDRICVKALSRRVAERYSTAKDLADDLRHWLSIEQASGATPQPQTFAAGTPQTESSPASVPTGAPIRASETGKTGLNTGSEAPSTNTADMRATIIPKGLRSFDAHDADFFLELLPGPRDREGLPEGLRFWKSQIEETDSDRTFRVGLVYGPSGCGKSSLVKAGLLPRLAGHVRTVYLEATADETESRLARLLQKSFPDLSAGSLVELLTALRRGTGRPPQTKLLVVLDQFEQWLHSRFDAPASELIRALRQCDGGRVQCLVLVRDDFWMAATRFMRELDLHLVERQNSAAVDLFDPLHARHVLSEFGRAFGRLPRAADECTPEQEQFLQLAVSELTEDGRIVPVRLALFAEMVKGKPWTPATLRTIGGIEGVGLTFLEDTFSSSTAPPAHRLHQQSARALLAALLPESGTDIKGHKRSRDELLAASGYAARFGEFAELLQILDSELRLITPTDVVDAVADESSASGVHSRFYQLTHDYLVPSLRQWLTREQQRTRRGRAHLRLAERSADWNDRPDRHRLPALWEWCNLSLFTRSRDWTVPQRRMMRAAGRFYVSRGMIVSVLVAGALAAGWRVRNGMLERQQADRASSLVLALENAETAQVRSIIEQLVPCRAWADTLLKATYSHAAPESRERLHASLALLPVDSSQVPYLRDRLLSASVDDLMVIREALADYKKEIIPALWRVLAASEESLDRRLRAACALAAFEPASDRWNEIYGQLADWLVDENPVQAGQWLTALRSISQGLKEPLSVIFRHPEQSDSRRTLAASLLAEVASTEPARLVDLLKDAQAQQFPILLSPLRSQQERAASLLEAGLDERLTPQWQPIAPASSPPGADVIGRIERAQGIVDDRFALCQTLPLDDLEPTVKALHGSGYRLVRLRPYAADQRLLVAAVWHRDGREIEWHPGLTSDELVKRNEALTGEGYLPIDVSPYAPPGAATLADARFGALWVKGDPDATSAQLIVAADYDDYLADGWQSLDRQGFAAQTQAVLEIGDHVTVTAIFRQPRHSLEYRRFSIDTNESSMEQIETSLQTDVRVIKRPAPAVVAEMAAKRLARAEKTLQTKPDDIAARVARAQNLILLDRTDEAADQLSDLLKDFPAWADYYESRAIALARSGRAEEAWRDVEAYRRLKRETGQTERLVAIVSASLGEPADWRERFEAAIAERAGDPLFLYRASHVFTMYARLIGRDKPEEAREVAARGLELLRDAIARGIDDYSLLSTDFAFEPLWGRPDFDALLHEIGCDVQYSTAGIASQAFESRQLHGLSPEEHLAQARDLAAAGYRIESLSVAAISADRPLVAASVWHRPVASEAARDQSVRRRAQCAVALLELGRAEPVWPMLRQSSDPGLRSELIERLVTLRSDPRRLLTRLESESGPSARQAMLLCLAEFPTESIPSEDREKLSGILLQHYRDDPDPGVHGACDLLLRRWGQGDRLTAENTELAARGARGARRWYVNRQGRTFTVVDGPIDFWMGSPSWEPNHLINELRHRHRISHTFAVAVKEVTVDEYQRFLRDHPKIGGYTLGPLDPEPACPAMGLTWFQAAQYCRWLSEREGISEDQMCYPPVDEIKDGMLLSNDYLERTGYRLPTSAEWECVCRAGAETRRSYGSSDDLLSRYEWYVGNSRNRSWPVGQLLPNDWGFFDMLGNASEWCQDRGQKLMYRRGPHGQPKEDHESAWPLLNFEQRVWRGANAMLPGSLLRCAAWGESAANTAQYLTGLRPARTLPKEEGETTDPQ